MFNEKRKLGNQLEVSEMGFGCMGMSFGYGFVGEKNEMIAAAVEIEIIGTRYPEIMERSTGL